MSAILLAFSCFSTENFKPSRINKVLLSRGWWFCNFWHCCASLCPAVPGGFQADLGLRCPHMPEDNHENIPILF